MRGRVRWRLRAILFSRRTGGPEQADRSRTYDARSKPCRLYERDGSSDLGGVFPNKVFRGFLTTIPLVGGFARVAPFPILVTSRITCALSRRTIFLGRAELGLSRLDEMLQLLQLIVEFLRAPVVLLDHHLVARGRDGIVADTSYFGGELVHKQVGLREDLVELLLGDKIRSGTV